MTAADIRGWALEVGLDDCGVAVAGRLDAEAEFMDQWIERGYHGTMSYLERHRALRYDIRALVPGAQTVVVGLLTYAHSGHDYHRAVKSRLYELEAKILAETGLERNLLVSEGQHIFVDSAPVLERAWAVRAGLGCIGRNHQLIHPTLGSWVHPGELVLQVPLEGVLQERIASDICADCHACIDACLGHALGREEWDACRCIAYITHKCTICQEVCPRNRRKAKG